MAKKTKPKRLTQDVDALISTLEQVIGEVSDLKRTVGAKLAELEERQDGLREHVDAIDSSVGRLISQYGDLSRTVAQLAERIADIEQHYEEFTTQVAARLESMQIRQAEQRDYPAQLPAALPSQYHSGRWKVRDGNIYGRYTYEGEPAEGQLDPWMRRSPPATD